MATESHITGRKKSPFVLIICTNAPGHIAPISQIVGHLVQKGYDVSWLGAEGYRPQIERSGSRFIACIGSTNMTVEQFFVHMPEYAAMAGGIDYLKLFMKIKTQWMPSGAESVRRALEHLHSRDPSREVVILVDCFASYLLPLQLGAELPKGYKQLPKSLGLNVIPAAWTSIDIGPPFFALPPDSTPAGRQRNHLLATMFSKICEDEIKRLEDTLLWECGALQPIASFFDRHPASIDYKYADIFSLAHDKVLQMCIPQLELPRSDWPTNFMFGGSLPRKPVPHDYVYPEWWDELLVNNARPADKRKKVIMVAQGTIIQDYNELIVPTIYGLANRDDFFVMAILGARGKTLAPVEQMTLPENVRVADYLLYDVALEQSDVFVVTAGYGAMQHAVLNGVPMVTAGSTEDKPEVALRAAHAGFAINLEVKTPTSKMVTEAVDEILNNGIYKKKAMELKKVAEEFGTLDLVEREMMALLD